MFLRPKARKEWLPLDKIRLDERLQLRDIRDAGGNRVLYDEDAAARYAEQMDEGDTSPPLECVGEANKKGAEVAYWLHAGFHRYAAHVRRKVASAEVLVYPGDFRT